MKQIKTICTIGPASESPEMLEKLVQGGMNIARVNFSHASYEQFIRIQETIKEFSTMYDKPVELMLDLQGPRMRVGVLPEKGLELIDGQEVIFTTDPENKSAIHINDPFLHQDVVAGHPIYLANGDLELLATHVVGSEIMTKVIRGGTLFSRKGVNLPETDVTTRGLTDKDKDDVAFGIERGVDYINMSFVRDAADMNSLRELCGNAPVKLVPKIERKQALHNLDEIILASDVIMVARGDLGIEVPLETLPLIQKHIVKRCNELGKPTIVATQMLMSMVDHARPTRAEVSDVANAVLDGAEVVMLSDETAFGKYPVEALGYLLRTAEHTQRFIDEQGL